MTIAYTVYSLSRLRFPNLHTKSKHLSPILRFRILRLLIMGKDTTPLTFTKLSGCGNYKKWSCEITFALQEAELYGYITGDRRKPREHTANKDNDEDRLEKIDQTNFNRLEFDKNEQ